MEENNLKFYEEKENIVKIIIELSIYYKLATSHENELLSLRDCAYILNNELDMLEENKTLFSVEPKEHIINKLKEELNILDKEEYKEYLKLAYLKIMYYYKCIKGYQLMDVASEEDAEQFAYEILYYDKSTQELKANIEKNMYVKYELGMRYLLIENYEQAYKLLEQASKSGHKKATFEKILCIYSGDGVEKDEEKAFIELKLFINKWVYCRAREKIGEMYYYGKGTEQNYKQALNNFKEAELTNMLAQYYLGIMYLSGYGIEKNEKKGIDYIIKSAERGCNLAINYIIENTYKKEKIKSINDTEKQTEKNKEFQEYANKFKERFGRFPYISEPAGTELAIEAIKECLDKDKDILDEIYGRKTEGNNLY